MSFSILRRIVAFSGPEYESRPASWPRFQYPQTDRGFFRIISSTVVSSTNTFQYPQTDRGFFRGPNVLFRGQSVWFQYPQTDRGFFRHLLKMKRSGDYPGFSILRRIVAFSDPNKSDLVTTKLQFQYPQTDRGFFRP